MPCLGPGATSREALLEQLGTPAWAFENGRILTWRLEDNGRQVRVLVRLPSASNPIGQDAIKASKLPELVMALPPIEEQNRIVARVAHDTTPLDQGLSTAEREVHLLNEFRTRLTADGVTDKLDVREAAAKLPDESVELDTATTEDLADDTLEEELAFE